MFDFAIRRVTFTIVRELDGEGMSWPVGRWAFVFRCPCRMAVRIGGAPPYPAVGGGIVRQDFTVGRRCTEHVTLREWLRMRELMPNAEQIMTIELRREKPAEPPPDNDELARRIEYERWALEYDGTMEMHRRRLTDEPEPKKKRGVLSTIETVGALIRGPRKGRKR